MPGGRGLYGAIREKLFGKTISLQQIPEELMQMDNFSGTGVTVIDRIP